MFGLILVGAAAVRLQDLSLMEFKGDEAQHHGRALDIAEHGHWPQVGWPSSRGNLKPPLFYYLLAIPATLDPEPVSMAAFIALLNALAVGLTFLLTSRFWGLRTGVIAATWYLASPWAIIYSRKIWNPDLVPIFSTLSLYGLLALWHKPKSVIWSLVTPFCLVAVWQLHDSGLAQMALGLLMVVWGRQRIHRIALTLGLGLAVLSMAPYLIYESQHGWRDLIKIGSIAAGDRGRSALFDLNAVYQTHHITGVGNFSVVLGESETDFRAQAGAAALAAVALQPLVDIALIGGWLALLVRMVRAASFSRQHPWLHLPEERTGEAILFLWLFILWAMFFFTGLKSSLHYFTVCYPVVFIIVALNLARLHAAAESLTRPVLRRVVTAALTLFIFSVPLCWLAFDMALVNHLELRGEARGDYGVAYRFKRAALEFSMARGLSVTGMRYEYAYLDGYLRRHRRTPAVAPSGIQASLFEHAPDRAPMCQDALDFGPVRLCPSGPIPESSP